MNRAIDFSNFILIKMIITLFLIAYFKFCCIVLPCSNKCLLRSSLIRLSKSNLQCHCVQFNPYMDMLNCLCLSRNNKEAENKLTHWPLWNVAVILNLTHTKDKYLEYFLWNFHLMNATRHHWWLFNIGSGNGLMLSSNTPLPEPMLTKFFDAIWYH